ncbi:MAG: lipopolysaccharide biosynthesis protein, partial [Rubritepida sp.]|nr:lipopolysaccharide biosynthesis protein [Rubritepida sp.]
MSAASLPAAMPAPQRQDWNEVVPLPADPFGAPARGGLHLSDVVITLWLHRRKLLIAFLVPVLLGLTAALLAPRRYMAESVLLVLATRETSGVQDLTGFLPNTMTVEILKATRSEVEILRSDEVLRRALQQAGLSTIFPDLSA